MEDHWSPLSLAYFYQDEGIEELRHCLFYITELEATIVSAKEEIKRREFEIINLKDLLNKTTNERDEAKEESQKLVLEKLLLQQKLKQHQLPQETRSPPPPLFSATSSGEESDFTTHITVGTSHFDDPLLHRRQPLQPEVELPEEILKLASGRPLPEKGKLLQAVKKAGPLLQTLLLAGPLPEWQHPPPQLDCIEIPPVTICSPASRVIHQESFNSLGGCLSKKRGSELCSSSPDSSSSSHFNKCQKISLIH